MRGRIPNYVGCTEKVSYLILSVTELDWRRSDVAVKDPTPAHSFEISAERRFLQVQAPIAPLHTSFVLILTSVPFAHRLFIFPEKSTGRGSARKFRFVSISVPVGLLRVRRRSAVCQWNTTPVTVTTADSASSITLPNGHNSGKSDAS